MELPKIFSFKTDSIGIKAEGDKEYIVGYISTHERDRVNDVVTKNCMLDMLNQFQDGRIKLDFEHEALRGDSNLEKTLNITRMPLGKSVSATYDGKGLAVRFAPNHGWKKFDGKGNTVMDWNDIKTQIKSGMLDAFSIAYLPIRTAIREAKDGIKERLLDKINMINVALTGNAINIGAKMTDVMLKSLDYMKDFEKTTMKTKSYDKDGGHAHTSNVPLGEHIHPEIEKAIERLWEKIWDVDKRLPMESTDEEQPHIAGKNKFGGDSMQDAKDNQTVTPPVKGDASTKVPQAKDDPKSPKNGDDEGEADAQEGLSQKEILEAKSLIANMKSMAEKMKGIEDKADDIKDKDVAEGLKEEIVKVNAQLKAFLESPQYKAVSEQMDKETKGKTGITESTGPLDFV